MKPPNSGHPEQQTCHEKRTKHLVPNVTIFFKLPPNSGHLSITDKFFKTRRCPLFRVSPQIFLGSVISFSLHKTIRKNKRTVYGEHVSQEVLSFFPLQRKFHLQKRGKVAKGKTLGEAIKQ